MRLPCAFLGVPILRALRVGLARGGCAAGQHFAWTTLWIELPSFNV
jgi:hypothetical protein